MEDHQGVDKEIKEVPEPLATKPTTGDPGTTETALETAQPFSEANAGEEAGPSVGAAGEPAVGQRTEPVRPAAASEPGIQSEPAPSEPSGKADAAVLQASRKHTRRSFAVGAVAAAAGFGFYRWVADSAGVEMQPGPLRRAFEADAAVSRAVFHEHALAPTYPESRAENLRINGNFGLKQSLVPESWRLQLVGTRSPEQHPRYAADVTAWKYRYSDDDDDDNGGDDPKTPPPAAPPVTTMAPPSADVAKKMPPPPKGADDSDNPYGRPPRGHEEAGESRSTLPAGTPGLLLTLDDVKRLPRHELVTQFKCIEGWSQIVHWAGVRMADFLEAYPPAPIDGREPRYVYMETPDGDYYCGYDLAICRHPQTLLVTEMMGAPLTEPHGAPLRLHMPTKYGYKQIKRIGLISYTNTKPDDYWTRLGYDWYAGL